MKWMKAVALLFCASMFLAGCSNMPWDDNGDNGDDMEQDSGY